jgi:hypothetical protein
MSPLQCFIRFANDNKVVTLMKTDGEEVDVVFERLTKENQEYVKERMKYVQVSDLATMVRRAEQQQREAAAKIWTVPSRTNTPPRR